MEGPARKGEVAASVIAIDHPADASAAHKTDGEREQRPVDVEL